MYDAGRKIAGRRWIQSMDAALRCTKLSPYTVVKAGMPALVYRTRTSSTFRIHSYSSTSGVVVALCQVSVNVQDSFCPSCLTNKK